MELYVSKTNNTLNRLPFQPELVTSNICINPSRKVRVKEGTKVLFDSGAFQDVKNDNRLSFKEALNRQLNYEESQNFVSELLVSYDRLVDEKHDEKVGHIKERVDYKTAEEYVEETINAAKFLADQIDDLKPRKPVLSCQGITTDQYLDCLKEIVSFADPETVIGFGGFCIVGLKPKYEGQYFEIIEKSREILKKKGIKRVHIFGVGKFKLLVRTHMIFREFGISASYDTSTYEINGVHGSVFNPYDLGLTKIFSKDEKHRLYNPAEIALFNIKVINQFWQSFNELYPVYEK